MSGNRTTDAEKEGVAGRKAASCGCMTMAGAEDHECCGGQMREMMSRFMASRGAGQKETPKCGDEGANDNEDK